jgi:CRP-like cAMP-binding protein
LENFVFSTLSEDEITSMINAMEPFRVDAGSQIILNLFNKISPPYSVSNMFIGKNVITQGEEGDFFYVLEKGLLTIIVNGSAVGTREGGSSFGELALMYDSPRAATIKADTASELFRIDRQTFRYLLAKSTAKTTSDVITTLRTVPLLQDLTDAQCFKIADAVQIVKVKSGM